MQFSKKLSKKTNAANVCKTDPNKYAEFILSYVPQDESNINYLCIVYSIMNKNGRYYFVKRALNSNLAVVQMFNKSPFQYYNHLTVKSKITNRNISLQSFGGLKRKPCDSTDTFFEKK